MEHITLRKRIDPKILLYIVVGLVSFPLVAYKVFERIDHQKLLRQANASLERGKVAEAMGTIQLNFEKHGYRKSTLEQYLSYLETRSPHSKSFEEHMERIRVCHYLIAHFRMAAKAVYRELGYEYYALGEGYYGLARSLLSRYIDMNEARHIEPQVYQHLYTIHNYEEDFERAERVAFLMHKSYPNNLDFKTQLASHHLKHGKVLSAKNLLEEIVYNEPYSATMAHAGNLLATLLETKLGLKEESHFVKKYLQYKNNLKLGQAFLPTGSSWMSSDWLPKLKSGTKVADTEKVH